MQACQTHSKLEVNVDRHTSFNMNCHHNITSDMQGVLWGEPELSHVWVFDHMVFFHSHNVNEV